MNRRSRVFRPNLETECLEPRRLLNGSIPADHPTDEQYDDLDAQTDQIGNESEPVAQLTITPLAMLDKDSEIAEINNLRNQFNQVIDSKIAIRQAAVEKAVALKAKVDVLNAAAVADFLANPGDPAAQADALKWGALVIKATNHLNGSQQSLQQMKDIKTQVNTIVDQVIANIKGTVYTMTDPDDPTNTQTFTEYTNEGYYTIA